MFNETRYYENNNNLVYDSNFDNYAMNRIYDNIRKLQDLGITDFSRIKNIKLINKNFNKFKFTKTIFSNWAFEDCIFSSADFQKTELNSTYLIGADFYKTNFEGASLWHTKFEGSDLSGANFKKSILNSVDMQKVENIENAHWEGATFDEKTKFPDNFPEKGRTEPIGSNLKLYKFIK